MIHLFHQHRRGIARFLLLIWSLLGCGLPTTFAQTPQQYRDALTGNPGSFRTQERKAAQQEDTGREGGDIEALSKGMALSEGVVSSVTYQVHIVGEVQSPGTYRVTASDRLQEVLQRAGGVLERGSLRNIQLRRKDIGLKTYDLLMFRLRGDLQSNPYVLDNDVVYVPLRKQVVQIVGSVLRPDMYELKGERTIAQAIALAGGFSVGVEKLAPLRIIRFEHGNKQVIQVPYHDADTFTIRKGDVVFVPNVLTAKHDFDYNVVKLPGEEVFYPSYDDRVFVLGGVYNPGPYQFNPYYSISQYLTLAGGTTKLSRTNAMKIIKLNGQEQQLKGQLAGVQVNPGETIFIPERRLPPESKISFVLGLVTTVLGTVTTAVALSRL